MPETLTDTQTRSADHPKFFGVYRGWAVVAFCMVMLAVGTGPIFYAYGIYAISFAETFGSSRTLINLAPTSTLLVGGLAAIPIGWLVDRYPVRPLLLLGSLGTAAGLALISLASEMWQIVAIYGSVIAAADVLLGMLAVNVIVARWFDRRRGLAIGLAAIGASLGAVIFPPFTGFLVEILGWRSSFLAMAAITAALVVPIWFLSTPPAHGLPVLEQTAQVATARPTVSAWAIINRREFWILTVAVGFLAAVNTGVVISIVAFAVANGTSPLDASTLVSIVGISAMAGKLSIGAVADRIDLRWTLRGAILACWASLVLLGFSQGDYSRCALAAVVFGISMGGQLPLWGAIAAKLYGTAVYGRVLGLSRAAMVPINFTLPLLAGFLFDWTGDYAWVWWSYAALAALTFVFTLAMRPFPATPSDVSR